jgi:putative spermidine/putrescine transport system permease protein
MLEAQSTKSWIAAGTVGAYVGYGFLLLPCIVILAASFGNAVGIAFPPRHLSLTLYRAFFSDPEWVSSGVRSLYIGIAVTLLCALTGFPAAYFLVRISSASKDIIEWAFYLPLIVPTIITALGTYLSFSHVGLIGTTTGLILAHSVATLPFFMLTVSAGLMQIDPSVEVAASIMGASKLVVFRKITLPLVAPALAAGALFVFLRSFDEAVVSNFICSPTTMTLPVKIYTSIQWDISPIITAVSGVMTLVSLVACLTIALSKTNLPGF